MAHAQLCLLLHILQAFRFHDSQLLARRENRLRVLCASVTLTAHSCQLSAEGALLRQCHSQLISLGRFAPGLQTAQGASASLVASTQLRALRASTQLRALRASLVPSLGRFAPLS